VAPISSVEQFGRELRAEAVHRGIARAKTVVLLGGDAAWVWSKTVVGQRMR